MDGKNVNEPEPSTSKNKYQKEHSDNESYDKKRRDGCWSNSGSWSIGSYSVKSREDMVKAQKEGADNRSNSDSGCTRSCEITTAKRDSKPTRRIKINRGDKRPRGRVDKRKRSVTRRKLIGRPPKRKIRIERRVTSMPVSTIFTRLSPKNAYRSKSPGCQYCGHRCCLRRYENELRRKKCKRCKRENNLQRGRRITLRSECIQNGSRCAMLSPLFMNTNATPASDVPEPDLHSYAEVTPEIIHETLEKLSMWKQGVSTHSIICHLLRTYPVNSDETQLLEELQAKLRIAVLVGIAAQLSADTWCLSSALEDRKLKQSHVTMFWKIYADTLRPVKRKQTVANDLDDNQTNTASITENKISRQNYFI